MRHEKLGYSEKVILRKNELLLLNAKRNEPDPRRNLAYSLYVQF